jgi:hypothetical protein
MHLHDSDIFPWTFFKKKKKTYNGHDRREWGMGKGKAKLHKETKENESNLFFNPLPSE